MFNILIFINNIGKLIEDKYPHIYWSPCAAHCLDLMFEDIFKLPDLKKTLERAIYVNNYIYNRTLVLNMMRNFTGQRDMVRTAKTRFATAFLTLNRFHKQKKNLKKMFTSDQWSKSKFAKEPGGKQVATIMGMPSFWNNVIYAIKIAAPLVEVLRLVDGEKKPPMGFIYEAMDRAKEKIAGALNATEKYVEIFEIIDERWNCQLHRPLHAAGYYLNPMFYFDNPHIEQDEEVKNGLYACIAKLARNGEEEDAIHRELSKYTSCDGLFGLPVAKRQRKLLAPGIFILKSKCFFKNLPNS